MMLADLLFYGVLFLFLILMLLLFFLPGKRSAILNSFSLLFFFLLVLLALSSQLPLYNDPVELRVTNYTSKKGELFFFRQEGCAGPVVIGYPVNANEASRLEMEGVGVGKLIFLTARDEMFELPPPEAGSRELEIWEKNLGTAPACYRDLIAAYRWEQTKFSLATGLLIYGLLLLFIIKFKKKRIDAARKKNQ